MTTTTPPAMGTGEAQIRRAVKLVEDAYPSGGGGWARRRFEAWVQALADLDPVAVERAARLLIRDWQDDRGRSPQPGHLRSRAIAATRATMPARGGVSIDEAALRDAKAALDYARDDQERAEIEEQVMSIRRRLPDHGQRVDERERQEVRYLRAEPHDDDPPGTLRFVVIYPDGKRNPPGGRVLGEGRGRVPISVPGVPSPLSALSGGGDDFPRGPLNGGA